MGTRTTQVTDASAWIPATLEADQSWLFRLDPEAMNELEQALAAVRQLPVTDIRKENFPLGRLADMLRAVSAQVEEGVGMAVVRGLPVLEYSKEDAARIFWGMGCHLGRPVHQNVRAHLLGHVRDEGVKYGHGTRGYNTSAKLNFHTDNCDVVGLLCLRAARSGGLSRITSSTSIFNRFVAQRPDLLPALFDGFYYDLKGEHLPGRPEISDHPIPVFSEEGGKLSCRYLRNAIEPGFVKSGRPATPQQTAALDFFDAQATAPDLCYEMELEPGDMQFLNNHVIVHSRTAFVDHEDEDRKRHLLRLWLRTDHRPLAPEFADRFGPGTARLGVPTPEEVGLSREAVR
ncbi:TauD/TfdA family dioxygenase [Pigmentiphaga soli]|uniref:TauD/TfdA family dioxygenase n=1 Tax=Pigmentiphaga soli TaxID=1007095 RepID=A0ABP8GLH3_9BURK